MHGQTKITVNKVHILPKHPHITQSTHPHITKPAHITKQVKTNTVQESHQVK